MLAPGQILKNWPGVLLFVITKNDINYFQFIPFIRFYPDLQNSLKLALHCKFQLDTFANDSL
jgi:hypothetical protein